MQNTLLKEATNSILKDSQDISSCWNNIIRVLIFLGYDPNFNLDAHSPRTFQRVYIV
jgi:hypothetical protein